jgi:outer membrane lipoprotein-sorting protein
LRLALLSCILTLTLSLPAQTHKGKAPKPVAKEIQNPLGEFKSFSANVTGGIAQDHDRKIYRSGSLMRLDFDNSYRVTDLNTLKMWGVSGEHCVEFERPDAGTFPFSAYRDFKVERFPTKGEETIDGHVCKIENVTLTPKDGRPLVVKMKLWKAEDLDDFPVRIDVEAGPQKFTSTYANVSLKAPDPKLFEHPKKCSAGAQPGQNGTTKIDHPGPKKDASSAEKPKE